MYTAVRQIVVNGLPVDVNLATVRDLEGTSLIATFTSPLTGKSYALFEKVAAREEGADQPLIAARVEGSLDGVCLRACRVLFDREQIVTHVLYKDYLLSRAIPGDGEGEGDEEGGGEWGAGDEATLEAAIGAFLGYLQKQRKFDDYLRRSGLA